MFAEAWSELERRSLAYYKTGGSVRLTESGCLGACSHGPTLAAYHAGPDGSLAQAWYVGMDGRAVLRVAEALHRGEPAPDEQRFDVKR